MEDNFRSKLAEIDKEYKIGFEELQKRRKKWKEVSLEIVLPALQEVVDQLKEIVTVQAV